MWRKQISRFLLVGFTGVMIDLFAYFLLLKGGVPVAISKASSFIIGMFFGYHAHRFWTFSSSHRSFKQAGKFILMYFFALLVNVSINSAVLTFIPLPPYSYFFAFVLATMASASLNFLGMKFFVFYVR